jgi:Secretion system C-terminal sorting domain
MVRIFTITILLLSSFISANAQWVSLGAKGFSNVSVNKSDMTVGANGLPVVAYIDANTKKTTVMKYFAGVTNTWDTLGNAEMSIANTRDVSIKTDNANNYWVATINAASKNFTVKKLVGSTWTTVGAPNFTGGADTSVHEFWDFAVSATGTPYVFFFDDATQRPHAMRFNGTTWVNVGAMGISPNVIDGGANIEIDNLGNPVIAYSDSDSYKIVVMKFNGAVWNAAPAPLYGGDLMQNVKLKLNSTNVPYIAYRDFSNSNNVAATVQKSSGSSWTPVGPLGFSNTGFWDLSLAIDNADMPIVAFPDAGQAGKATVLKYDNTSWAPVGGSTGFTASGLNYPVVTTDPSGNPYLSFQDWDVSDFSTVMKLFNNPLSIYNLHLNGNAEVGKNNITCILDGNVLEGNLFLEKSADGMNFEQVSQTKVSVDIINAKSAHWTDINNLAQSSFYRVKFLDPSGNGTYSNTINLKSVTNKDLNIFPNPATEKVFILGNSNSQANITNSQGQVVATINVFDKGTTTLNIESYPVGMYQIKIIGSDFVKTFIKK